MGPNLCITDYETQEAENVIGGTNPFTGKYTRLLYKARDPVSHEDSPGSETSFIFHLFCGTKSMHYRSRNTARDFGWNQLPCLAFIIFKIRDSNVSKKARTNFF